MTPLLPEAARYFAPRTLDPLISRLGGAGAEPERPVVSPQQDLLSSLQILIPGRGPYQA